jgi:2-oxoglutarate dehydrogenase E1 component
MDSKRDIEADNAELLESLYQQYQSNPSKVDPSWQKYFQTFDQEDVRPSSEGPEARIRLLIHAYRLYGHLGAQLNPLREKTDDPQQLQLQNLGFQPEEVEHVFPTCGLLPALQAPLKAIIERLRSIYCHHIGFEYKGLTTPEIEKWIEQRIESAEHDLSAEQRQKILEYLNHSELFESFLHMKYVGQKRFSLEGAETLIPMLALLIEKAAKAGVKEIVLGMSHRGRLNVLSNILKKSLTEIFQEFDEGYISATEGMGDVKYHKGYTSTVSLQDSPLIKVTLPPNPSHLESVNAVVEGQVRAKQFLQDDKERSKILPLLIHGDAALAGQGVVYEALQLFKLPGYTTGGTIHFALNNHIGFTTLPRDTRSTLYCTDIAHAFNFPIFHVNAEDPESCIEATLLAYEIRQQFHCDVFIDLNCYRKYGHNESDEPFFTQPLEYQLIRKKKLIRDLYRESLLERSVIDQQVIDQMEKKFRQDLQDVHSKVLEQLKKDPEDKKETVEEVDQELLFKPFETGVPQATLLEVARRFSHIPEGFQLHPKLERLVKERLSMVEENKAIDWGMAEFLAYATLIWQNIPIRISGQDCCRGTFSHRHALWVDQSSDAEYYPLSHLKEDQANFSIYNSPLSEYAILGFEYGYSVACLDGLTIWEAQFGDFSNGAQIAIDQYIVSGEQKWGQQSGLTLFLPHGYEGQGSEHSSARLERFLTLAGHDNIQLVNPTTPAQFFHLLRRQMLRSLRKPLVIFTPKGLLRHPKCVSSLNELMQGAFHDVLNDPLDLPHAKRIVFCSGRIFYDLIEQRKKEPREDIVFIRIEQLYPLNVKLLQEICASYPHMQQAVWVQEEPQNMGAWSYIYPYLNELLPNGIKLEYIGRIRSASPATGSHLKHHLEHTKILNQVFCI